MALSSRISTLANGQPMLIPPMQPSPSDKPTDAAAPSTPATVWALKLTDEEKNQFLSSRDQATIEFSHPDKGVITIPGADPLNFTTRRLSEPGHPFQSYCFTRRAQSVRFTGPIHAEMELDRRMSKKVATKTRTRTIDAKEGPGRELKLVEALPTPPKRPRVRKSVDKRPRAPARTTRTSSLLNSNAPLANGHANGLGRSWPNGAVASSSPLESPVVSPGHIPRSGLTAMANGSRRGTPTGAGLPPRNTSPNNPVPFPPKTARYTPTRSNHVSPSVSRGPSPILNSSAPSSPRTGNLRPKSQSYADLRRNVIHILALGEHSAQAVRSRLGEGISAPDRQSMVHGILHEVGETKRGLFTLKDELWSEVDDHFPAYSDLERTRVKSSRVDVESSRGQSSANGSEQSAHLHSMTDAQVEAAIDKFEKMKRSSNGKLATVNGEQGLRKSYNDLFPLYSEIMRKMQDLSNLFSSLGTRIRDAKGASRDALAERISSQYEKHQGRYARFTKVLPLIHSYLAEIRKKLEEGAESIDSPTN